MAENETGFVGVAPEYRQQGRSRNPVITPDQQPALQNERDHVMAGSANSVTGFMTTAGTPHEQIVERGVQEKLGELKAEETKAKIDEIVEERVAEIKAAEEAEADDDDDDDEDDDEDTTSSTPVSPIFADSTPTNSPS